MNVPSRIVSAVLTCCFAMHVHASLIVPSGLSPGDAYQIAFVTDGVRNAVSADIDDYNGFVQGEAERVGSLFEGSGLTWKVIASTGAVNAVDNAIVLGPVYTVGGALVASSFADFWDGSHFVAISTDQFGNLRGDGTSERLFTGSSIDGSGVADATNFLGSTFLGNPGSASLGDYGRRDIAWINDDATRSVVNLSPFYALSSVLTVPNISSTVPAPPTVALTLVGILMLAVKGSSSRKPGGYRSGPRHAM